jgi:hypothetical protein
MTILNSRNFAKLVWIDLIQIWKVFERNKENKKRKEEKKNKNRNGP